MGRQAMALYLTWLGSVDQFGTCTTAVLAAVALGHGDELSGSHHHSKTLIKLNDSTTTTWPEDSTTGMAGSETEPTYIITGRGKRRWNWGGSVEL
jgi:hypothetical protein